MNKKKLLSLTAASIILLGMLSACSQDDQTPSNTKAPSTPATTAPPTTMAPEQQEQTDAIKVKDFDLENKEITFLASWARNPAGTKNKDVAIELFQTKFGGKINDMVVGDSERFEKLAALVSTGSSPDFFSAGDMDAFPRGAISQMFQPLDDIIDYNDEWFGELKSINEPFMYKGKHYVSVISPEIDVLMIYNKAVIAENGLTDPAELFAAGNWNWTTCRQLMNEFCDKSDENYATDGWWITKGFIGSTGVPLIGMEDGMVKNNLRDPLVAEAEEFLYNLNIDKMAYPVWDYGWVSNPGNVGIGKTLFYPVGYWALTELDTSQYSLLKYGDPQDIGFVPVPKCPSVDEFYIPARINGYMLCSGAPNPQGFACMMYCEVAASGSEEAEKITKEQYFNEYQWTDEMWEMRNTMFKMVREHPVFDFSSGISAAMFDAIDNPSKDAYHNGTSWTQTKETIFGSVQTEVDKANGALES